MKTIEKELGRCYSNGLFLLYKVCNPKGEMFYDKTD